MITRIPTHPGAILREDVLPEMHISMTAAAEGLGISRQMLHKVLHEKAPVTADMANRLGKFIGNGAEIWSAMQTAYDLAKSAIAIEPELKKIRPWRAAA